MADIGLYRALLVLPASSRRRKIRLRQGVTLTYRLNRGDIQGIREVWMADTYRLPVDPGPVETIVDLGANIGLASVYLARRYGCLRLVAVEPVPENAELIRLNLRQNGIRGEVIEAAVGPSDSSVRFVVTRDSNVGRVGNGDAVVRMVSMETVLADLRVDVLKLDIEGGEEPLLDGDRSWLDHVRLIIAEFHPSEVDYPRLVDVICQEGFDYIKAGTVYPNSADTFLRRNEPARISNPSRRAN